MKGRTIFHDKKDILLPKLLRPIVRKNCYSDREKLFEVRGCRPRIFKHFEITYNNLFE